MLPRIFSDFVKSEDVLRIFDALEAVGGHGCLRFVGGCVRNALLEIDINDIDFATQLSPDQVERALADRNIHTITHGKAYGTICAIINSAVYEITSLRKDMTSDGRRAEVIFGQDWTADAYRRDFTINALYCDRSGQVFDPTEEGLTDINRRIVRFIGDPEKRIKEDYLRILRFYRFSAQFSVNIDIDSARACGKLISGIKQLSAERIWSELQKILAVPDPSQVITLMSEQGLITLILGVNPESLCNLMPFRTMCQLSADPLRRFMSLIIGCGLSNETERKRTAELLRLSKVQFERINKCLALYDSFREIEINIDEIPCDFDTKAIRKALYFSEATTVIDALYLAAAIQNRTKYLTQWLGLAEQPKPDFSIKGGDLIALGWLPGPNIKAKLSEIEAQWIEADFDDQVVKSILVEAKTSNHN